jgi:hypothetical protein
MVSMSKWPLILGTTPDGDDVVLPLEALKRHAVALGASGSGKTVFCKVVVEEVVRHGLPVICIDPQGDLASLGLVGDPDKLVQMGVDPKVAHEYHSKADVKIWTPGSSYGIPLSIAPSLSTEGIEREEDKLRAFASIAGSLASIAGYALGSEAGETAMVAFSLILEYADSNGLLIENLSDFADFLHDPPLALAEQLEPIMGEKERPKVERKFRVKMLGSNKLLYDLGQAIHPDTLFGYENGGAYDNGKVRVSVIYLNTLTSPEEKEIFVSMLCNALYQWMLQAPSQKPVGLLYLDEVAPFIPPVRKPASKASLMLLLRQARKYGLCVLLATQSPGDLDYKALGQIGTWALGKMTTAQEAAKVAPSLRAEPNLDTEAIIDSLPSQPKGRFVLINADHFDGPTECQVRWLVSRHETLSPDQVESLTSDEDREILG